MTASSLSHVCRVKSERRRRAAGRMEDRREGWEEKTAQTSQSLVSAGGFHIQSVYLSSGGPFIWILWSPSASHPSLRRKHSSSRENKEQHLLCGSEEEQSCIAAVRGSTGVLWARSALPAVSVGTTRNAELSSPSAPTPPSSGSAGSCAARGWRRRPTDHKQNHLEIKQNKKVFLLVWTKKTFI